MTPSISPATIGHRTRCGISSASRQRQFLRVCLAGALASVLWTVSSICLADPAWTRVRSLELPYGIQALDWHPDGKHVAVTYSGKHLAQVWDVVQGQGLQTFPSTRWGTTQSGKEIGFSPDGKYLVVQDFQSTKPKNAPYPKSIYDPLETEARMDKSAYQIGRIWDWGNNLEVSRIMGPGAKMYSASMSGFCWTGGPSPVFAVHRNAAVAVYSFPQGKLLDEVSILNPHPKHPEVDEPLWWRMVCDPRSPRVAVQGALLPERDLKALDLSDIPGPTPIAVVDLQGKRLERTLISKDALNGIVFTADGRYLVAYGRPPMQVWDALRDFAPAGEIREPAQNTGTMAALHDDWMAGMSDSLNIWRVGTQQKAQQDQPVARFSWRTAYHPGTQTLAVASGTTLTLYQLQPQAVSFGAKP